MIRYEHGAANVTGAVGATATNHMRRGAAAPATKGSPANSNDRPARPGTRPAAEEEPNQRGGWRGRSGSGFGAANESRAPGVAHGEARNEEEGATMKDEAEQPRRVLLEISTDAHGLNWRVDQGLRLGELLILRSALEVAERQISEILWTAASEGVKDDDDE